MPRIALAPDFGVSPIPNFGAPTVLNMYPEIAKGKGLFPLVGDRGKKKLADCGAPGRGQFSHLGVHYAVGGQTLYRVEADFNLTELGTLPGVDPVRFAANATQIWILAAPRAYVLDLQHLNFAEVTDPDFPGASDITCLNNVGVFVQAGNLGRWGTTRAGDFSDIDGADIATAESNADPLVGAEISNNILILPGTASTELWANSGEGNPPFNRVAVLDIGCAARDTICHFDSTLIFMASTRAGGTTIMKVMGGAPQRVATHAVERMIARSTNPAYARGFTYWHEGHEFYEISMDSGSCRLDAETGLWTQTATGVWPVGDPSPGSRFLNCVTRDGVNVFQDGQGGLYIPATDDWTDDGAPLVRLFRTPVIAGNGKLITINRVEIELETGLSPLTEELQVQMAMSRDGGHTWPVQRTASVGAHGNYGSRVQFRALGQVQNATLEFRFTGNAPFNVTGVYADIVEDLRV